MTRVIARVALLSSLCTPSVVLAHHSGSEYDQRNTVEIEGTLVELVWQNPHVHFGVRTTDPSGKPVVWDIEANSVSILSRTDANPSSLKIGDRIKIAGAPSRRAPNRMWASNVLPANGREVVLGPGIRPRWQATADGSKSTWFDGGKDANKTAGIFRVWSTKFDEPGGLWRRDYPLTDAAKKKRAAFNPLTDTVAPGCRPKGMPTIMGQPYPLEFVNKGDTILLRMEEYDTVRTINMKGSGATNVTPRTLLGSSQGRWEGDTLVVTTSRISWPYFDSSGVPLGPSSTIVERFTPTPDGTHLTLTMTVTDRDTFSQPVELKRSWVWRPGETVKPYNCVERKTASR